MITKKYFTVAVALFITLFIISGCSIPKKYARLELLPYKEGEAKREELKINWQDYNVYYSGSDTQHVKALLLDPKNDDKTIQGDMWIPVNDEATLSKIAKWFNINMRTTLRIYNIIGPNGDFFGYIYASHNRITLKVIDEKTLYVFEI